MNDITKVVLRTLVSILFFLFVFIPIVMLIIKYGEYVINWWYRLIF